MNGKLVTLICCCLVVLLAHSALAAQGEDYRMVRDFRGKEVRVPKDIKRVVTISDGLVETVMYVLGEQDKLVGVGSNCLGRNFNYTYPTESGGSIVFRNGMGTARALIPELADTPLIADWNRAPNYELIAGLKPDVMIVRAGSCWTYERKEAPKAIGPIEAMGIPVVVLESPNMMETPDLSRISEEIRVIGRVFGKEERAAKLADYLESQIALIRSRTGGIPEADKPRVLLFGLSPRDRKAGGAGNVKCGDDIESHILVDLAGAVNACPESGGQKRMSAEQVLALAPDVVVLPTSFGYHPPRELYEAPYYANLRELPAVKNRRVASLPWTPCNCDKRVEYPIDAMIMAKAAYPEKFKDIDLPEWLLEFYRTAYGVDRETAVRLRTVQWLDWTMDEQ